MFSVLKLDPTHFALTLFLYFWRILIYISWGCHHTSNIWSRQLVSRKCLKFYSPLWSHPIPWNRDLNELQLTLPLDDISTHDSAFLADRFLIYIFQCKQSTPIVASPSPYLWEFLKKNTNKYLIILIISPGKETLSFFWKTNLNLLHPMVFSDKFGWNWSNGS